MKTRKSVAGGNEIVTSPCCGSGTAVQEAEGVCCEQPTDGSSCCNKSDTKESNSENTGCC
jgi:hypothetical protein